MKILPNLTVKNINTHYHTSQKENVLSVNNNHIASPQIVPSNIYRASFMPVFTSLDRRDTLTGMPIHSGFYRDPDTLFNATEIITQNFKNGGDIIVGACSSGEDLISLYSMMPHERYRFIGVDTSADALAIANKNIYSIIPDYGDDFLLNTPVQKIKNALPVIYNTPQNNTERILTECFKNVMEKAPKPDFRLNAHPLDTIQDLEGTKEPKADFYRVKDCHRKNLEFENFDMRVIHKFEPERKAAAILFRNALYLVTGNYLNAGISSDKGGFDRHNNMAKCLNQFVDSVYNKLDVGGIFVVGDIAADHVYLADDYTPKRNRIQIDNLKMFDEDIDYYMADPEAEICEISPLEIALIKGGRFRQVYSSNAHWHGYKFRVPTIWQKVE